MNALGDLRFLMQSLYAVSMILVHSLHIRKKLRNLIDCWFEGYVLFSEQLPRSLLHLVSQILCESLLSL